MYQKRTMNTEMTAISVTMSVDKAHEILGHLDESCTRMAAKVLGSELSKGSLKTQAMQSMHDCKGKAEECDQRKRTCTNQRESW